MKAEIFIGRNGRYDAAKVDMYPRTSFDAGASKALLVVVTGRRTGAEAMRDDLEQNRPLDEPGAFPLKPL